MFAFHSLVYLHVLSIHPPPPKKNIFSSERHYSRRSPILVSKCQISPKGEWFSCLHSGYLLLSMSWWWHLTSTWEFTWTITWNGLMRLQLHTRKVRADSIYWGSSGPLESRGYSLLLSMTLWWHQPFSMASSAGAAASKEQTGGDLKNLSRRPAPSWDALLTQCRWWERAGCWTSCHLCWCRSPTPCRPLSQLLQQQTNITLVCEGEVSQVLPSCCFQAVQPALLPIDLTLHCAIKLYKTHSWFCTIWLIFLTAIFRARAGNLQGPYCFSKVRFGS